MEAASCPIQESQANKTHAIVHRIQMPRHPPRLTCILDKLVSAVASGGISASPPPLHPGMMGVWTRESIRKFVAQAQGRCLVEAGTALQLRCNQFPSRPWS